MPIPDYQTLMLPFLRLLGDGKEHALSDLSHQLSIEFNLTKEELSETLSTGGKKFHNRVQWARVYLSKSGLLDTPGRAVYKITKEGLEVLNKSPDKIDGKLLEQFEGYRAFVGINREKTRETSKLEPESSLTPDEIFSEAFEKMERTLRDDLLEKIMDSPAIFFEKLVPELLLKMGYGPFKPEVTRSTNDGGIDAIIPQDQLGLDNVYIQVKRWTNNVQRDSLQQFVGALEERKTNKGIFVTTSGFSKGAKEYVSKANRRIVLIDGEKLSKLMVDHNVGVETKRTFNVKTIVSNYFPGPGSTLI